LNGPDAPAPPAHRHRDGGCHRPRWRPFSDGCPPTLPDQRRGSRSERAGSRWLPRWPRWPGGPTPVGRRPDGLSCGPPEPFPTPPAAPARPVTTAVQRRRAAEPLAGAGLAPRRPAWTGLRCSWRGRHVAGRGRRSPRRGSVADHGDRPEAQREQRRAGGGAPAEVGRAMNGSIRPMTVVRHRSPVSVVHRQTRAPPRASYPIHEAHYPVHGAHPSVPTPRFPFGIGSAYLKHSPATERTPQLPGRRQNCGRRDVPDCGRSPPVGRLAGSELGVGRRGRSSGPAGRVGARGRPSGSKLGVGRRGRSSGSAVGARSVSGEEPGDGLGQARCHLPGRTSGQSL
jgi:hypothetical protein